MFLIPFGILNGAKVPIMDYFLKNLLPVTIFFDPPSPPPPLPPS